MNFLVKNNHLNFIITCCVIVLFSIILNFDRKIAIDGDARDYYSYLVSLFINHNFTQQVGNDWYLIQTPTGTINVHTIGVALLTAPFFFVAFGFAKLAGFEADGFSLPFQIGIYVAGIFYCMMGLIYLKKLLLQLNIKNKYVAALIIICCFGTHLFSYTVNEPGMAHVYSFALTSMFFYFVLNLFEKQNKKYFYFSAFVLGLIILVRPINVILLTFIPFFFNNKNELINTFKGFFKSLHFYLALIVLGLVCFIQSFAWYCQNGLFLQDSYVGNGFYFSSPQIFKMLFEFNNGLFIYVPMCLLLLFGVFSIFKVNKFKGFVFSLSLGFIFYLFSSYWAYNYFDGFGIRTLVDFLPIFIIAGAYMFQNSRPKFTFVIGLLALFFLSVNLLHTYQYRSGIIKANGMNFEKYKYVFLKTDKAYADSLGGYNDLPLYSKTEAKLLYDTNSSNQLYQIKNQDTTILFDYKINSKQTNRLYTVLEFERKETHRNSSFDGVMLFKATDSLGGDKTHNIFLLNETPANNCCDWKKYTYSIATIGKFDKTDKWRLMILNPKKANFFIKNITLKTFDYTYTI